MQLHYYLVTMQRLIWNLQSWIQEKFTSFHKQTGSPVGLIFIFPGWVKSILGKSLYLFINPIECQGLPTDFRVGSSTSQYQGWRMGTIPTIPITFSTFLHLIMVISSVLCNVNNHFHEEHRLILILSTIVLGHGALGVTCSPRDPRLAGSNPAEGDGLFQDVKILSTSPTGGTLSWGSRVCIGKQWPPHQYDTIQYNTSTIVR